MRKFIKSNKRIKKSNSRVEWKAAPDIEKRVKYLISSLELEWIRTTSIYCFRSKYSKSRAHARIWGLSRIWQKALGIEASYVVEVLSEKFDPLAIKDKDKVLLHELAHIPKNFSGSLLPHIRKRGKRNFEDRVNQLVRRYSKRNSK